MNTPKEEFPINPNRHRMLAEQAKTFPRPTTEIHSILSSTLIKDTIEEVKTITQAPESMIYLTALSAISVAMQGLINVELLHQDTCPVSLFTLSLADSGERKSSVFNLLTKGINDFKKQDMQKNRQKTHEYAIDLSIHNKQIKSINRSTNFDIDTEVRKSRERLITLEENKPIKPMLNMLTFEDTTIEGLLWELHENVQSGFLGTSEGGILFKGGAMSKTAHLNSIWSDGTANVTRKSKESFYLEEARLTIQIMSQKVPFDNFLNKSKGEMRDNGFLSRMLVCRPGSTCGSRTINEGSKSQVNLERFNSRLTELLLKSAAKNNDAERDTVRLSSDAKGVLKNISGSIEKEMSSTGRFSQAQDHASKLCENIVRVAALIHCFEVDDLSKEEITEKSLRDAINLVAHFSGEFMTVFDPKQKEQIALKNLSDWFQLLRQQGTRYIKHNDTRQRGPNSTRNKADLEIALNQLQSSGRSICIDYYRRTKVIDLHPSFYRDDYRCQSEILRPWIGT